MFKCFVGKNRNHGGQPIHSHPFLEEILLKLKKVYIRRLSISNKFGEKKKKKKKG